MIKLNRLILIGSAGINSGKTVLACKLIELLKSDYPITGVKITVIDKSENFCKKGLKDCNVCSSLKGDYEISEEKNQDLNKDTSKMLKAGADNVLWLKVSSLEVKKGLTALLKKIPKENIIICESNSVRKAVEPLRFTVIKNKDSENIKESCRQVINYADSIIDTDSFDEEITSVINIIKSL